MCTVHMCTCLPFPQPEITNQNVLLAALQMRVGEKKGPLGTEKRSDFLSTPS